MSNLDESQLINLYAIFRSRIDGNMQLRGMYTNYFLTVISAITGFVVLGIRESHSSPLIWFLLIGPFVNLILCYLAIKVANSCYSNFLEQITVTAKLEKLLKLDNIEGESIIPERWLSRQEEFNDVNIPFSPKRYVKKNLYKSSNRDLVFCVLIYGCYKYQFNRPYFCYRNEP